MSAELSRLVKFAADLGDPTGGVHKPAAKTLLVEDDDDCPASAVYTATMALYGIELLSWEPETIWLTMKKDGIDLSQVSRNKLQAAITLIDNPSFYWDSVAYQRTVKAFNSELYNPDMIQECSSGEMSWAVYEAAAIRGMDPEDKGIPEFDEDVQSYAAVCLKRGGLVLPPDNLIFAEEALDQQYLPKAQLPNLKKSTKYGWSHLDKGALQRTEFPEDPLGVQLAKLAAIYLYVETRATLLALKLVELKGTAPT